MAARKKAKARATARKRRAGSGPGPRPAPLSSEELGEALDALYRAPLADFIDRRRELVARLKRASDERAASIGKLAKPVVSAWVTNRLALERPELLDELREAGDVVRELQTGAAKAGGPEAHRQAATRRREALEHALEAAESLLEASGQAAARGTLLRVRSSLESLAIYGTAAEPDPPAGRLAKDIDPPGLDVLAQIAPAPGRGGKRKRTTKSPRRKAKAAPRPSRPRESAKATAKVSPAARRRAEEALRRSQAAVREAGRRLKNAERSREGAERSLERVRSRLVEAEERFAAADAEHRQAAAERDSFAAREEEARQALEDLIGGDA